MSAAWVYARQKELVEAFDKFVRLDELAKANANYVGNFGLNHTAVIDKSIIREMNEAHKEIVKLCEALTPEQGEQQNAR